jgi:hypothetical protein
MKRQRVHGLPPNLVWTYEDRGPRTVRPNCLNREKVAVSYAREPVPDRTLSRLDADRGRLQATI